MLDFILNSPLRTLGLFFGLLLSWGGWMFWRQWQRQNNRDQEFERIAADAGFEFLGTPEGFLELIKNHLGKSVLVSLPKSNDNQWSAKQDNPFKAVLDFLDSDTERTVSHHLRCENISHHKLVNGDCFLFDFERLSVTEHHKNSQWFFGNADEETAGNHHASWKQTVIFGYFPSTSFPKAIIRPKSLRRMIGKWIKNDEIILPQLDERFTKKYALIGKDSSDIATLLTNSVVTAILSKPNYEIEFWGNVFIVTLDLETNSSFSMTQDLVDGRIGIDNLNMLRDFARDGLALLKTVDQTVA